MNIRLTLLAAGLSVLAIVAKAQTETAVPVAAETTVNVGVVSEYRARGLSQSRFEPALQAGADYSNGGFYLGTFASTTKWIRDFGGKANVEVDLYGGYSGELGGGWSYDLGVLGYFFPDNDLHPSANTAELYAGLSYGVAKLKFSRTVSSNFLAVPDSGRSYYIEASANLELGQGYTVVPHVGHQSISGPNGSDASYSDASLTLSKDFKGFTPSLMLVATNAKRPFYTPGGGGLGDTRSLGRTALVLGLKYTF